MRTNIIGIGLKIFSCVVLAVANVIQKKAHIHVSDFNKKYLQCNTETCKSCIGGISIKKSILTNRCWIFGFLMYIFGSLIGAVAMKYECQSILCPLSASVMVFNAIFAWYYLNEHFKRFDIPAMILIIIGTIGAVLFGPHQDNNTEFSINDLKQRYDSSFFIFLSVFTTVTIINYVLMKIYFGKNVKKNNILLISYLFIAAFFGSINQVIQKSSVIIVFGFKCEYFSEWFLYYILCMFVLNCIGIEYWRQKSIKYFDIIYVTPVYRVLLIVGTCLIMAVYFKEFEGFGLLKIVCFLLSILLTFVGIFVMMMDGKPLECVQTNKSVNDIDTI